MTADRPLTQDQSSQDQSSQWSSLRASAWVQSQALIDGMFGSIEEFLVASAPGPGDVLDIGCGTGATTVAVARELAPGRRCVGVDISPSMIDAARARAADEGSSAEFVCADVQEHEFTPATFDVVISRFGVMFFSDPVRAFTNLRRAATPAARLSLIVWRGTEDNPFMTTAERAAAPLVPTLPARPLDGPGQMGFADSDVVRSILAHSGWEGVDVAPVDFGCAFPVEELEGYFTRFGLLGQVFDTLDEATRAQVVEVVRAAFTPFVHGSEVRFTAACWSITARATGRA